jgi:glycosyltransferase involved in cell wall biosynthesis
VKGVYLVSVVIPAYNRAQFIEGAIQSVLTQTYTNLEVIVVDDGSTDNTVPILEEYARKDPRIRLIQHSHRKGGQAARNTGIHTAQGQWIAFLDSDDQWLPNSLDVRLQIARSKGLHVVHSECYVLKPGSVQLQRFGHSRLQGNVYRLLLRRCGTLFPSFLLSKEALTRIGYLDETIVSYQEWDTAIRLAKYYEFAFVQEPTFIYDCSSADTISKDLLRTAQGYEQVFLKHRRSILCRLGPKALASHYQRAADLYREANEEDEARRCFRIAILLWPFRPRTVFGRVRRLMSPDFKV